MRCWFINKPSVSAVMLGKPRIQKIGVNRSQLRLFRRKNPFRWTGTSSGSRIPRDVSGDSQKSSTLFWIWQTADEKNSETDKPISNVKPKGQWPAQENHGWSGRCKKNLVKPWRTHGSAWCKRKNPKTLFETKQDFAGCQAGLLPNFNTAEHKSDSSCIVPAVQSGLQEMKNMVIANQ